MDKSQEIFEKACRLMPGGVSSPVRAFRAVGMTPRFIERAKGSHIYDVDGHDSVSYTHLKQKYAGITFAAAEIRQTIDL